MCLQPKQKLLTLQSKIWMILTTYSATTWQHRQQMGEAVRPRGDH